jgi:hypothetical protein
MKQDTWITRRGFMKLSSGALVISGVLNPSSKIVSARSSPTSSDQVSLSRKVALEGHFDFAGIEKSMYPSFGGPEFQGRITPWAAGGSQRWTEGH